MLAVLRHQDPQPGESRTVRFEGRDYGSQVSIFLVDADPGRGVALHVESHILSSQLILCHPMDSCLLIVGRSRPPSVNMYEIVRLINVVQTACTDTKSSRRYA